MTRRGRFPAHGWMGLALIAVFWPLNWFLEGMRSHWCFFPLWLGYCLAVDGISVYRRGSSLLTRNRWIYVSLFVISVPLWWVFEVINFRTQNWRYVGRELVGVVEYPLLASLSFSTVVPAVLGTAEMLAGFDFMQRFRRGPALRPGRHTGLFFFAVGLVMFSLMMAWPRYFFPFVWLSLYFLVEPVNLWMRNRSLLEWTREGDWRPLASLWMGVLVCGFFWEMWNFLSYPKWVYTIPGFDSWRLFEMPLPGYLGYLPFSLELFAVVHLVLGLVGQGRSDYVSSGLMRG